MPYWQLYYHIVWSTRGREPTITLAIEPLIHDFIRVKAIGLGCIVYALNGMSDHIHLVASIPPTIAIATCIGQIKGVTTAKYNKRAQTREPIYWQEEYGIFSVDRKRLPGLIAYVEGQKQHHANNEIIVLLERDVEQSDNQINELPSAYGSIAELHDF
jgi:putative transposase